MSRSSSNSIVWFIRQCNFSLSGAGYMKLLFSLVAVMVPFLRFNCGTMRFFAELLCRVQPSNVSLPTDRYSISLLFCSIARVRLLGFLFPVIHSLIFGIFILGIRLLVISLSHNAIFFFPGSLPLKSYQLSEVNTTSMEDCDSIKIRHSKTNVVYSFVVSCLELAVTDR